MRLIDGDELLAQMIGMNDGWFDPRPAYDHESLIKIQPTVDAVPMDKLCELLAEHYEPPYSMADIYKLKMPIDFNQQKEIWRATIIRWMEEQDAAD